MSPRYTYITPFGIKIELVDYMFSSMGIEGIAEGKEEGKYALVLVLQDGSVLYDYETDKTPEDMQKARDEFKALEEKQTEQFKERSKELIYKAAQLAGMTPEEYAAAQGPETMELSEDGEVSEDSIPTAPAEYKPHSWTVTDPEGYA